MLALLALDFLPISHIIGGEGGGDKWENRGERKKNWGEEKYFELLHMNRNVSAKEKAERKDKESDLIRGKSSIYVWEN